MVHAFPQVGHVVVTGLYEDLDDGKVFARAQGLNGGPYGGRFYDATRAQWTTMDPSDEFHSPYVS